jgi:hypothetical protein
MAIRPNFELFAGGRPVEAHVPRSDGIGLPGGGIFLDLLAKGFFSLPRDFLPVKPVERPDVNAAFSNAFLGDGASS